MIVVVCRSNRNYKRQMVMEEDMAEIWDIYDRYGNRTGRTMKRGIPKRGRLYVMCTYLSFGF